MPSDLATEDRILEAAHRVFVRRGVAAARTQEIADEAGVNKALLHYYYRSKEKLSDAVFARAARDLFPRMMAALASDLPLRGKLQEAIQTEMDQIELTPFLPGYILCEMRAHPERLAAVMAEAAPPGQFEVRVLAPMQRQIDDSVEAGWMRPTEARTLVVALMSLLIFPHAASHMLAIAAGLDAQGQADLAAWRREHLADFLLRGFAS